MVKAPAPANMDFTRQVVGVKWAPTDIAMIYAYVGSIFNEGTPISIKISNLPGDIEIDDIFASQQKYPEVPDPIKYPQPPLIQQKLTGAMTGAYYVWTYEPYKVAEPFGAAESYYFNYYTFYGTLAGIMQEDLSYILDPTEKASASERVHWLFLPFINPPSPFLIGSFGQFQSILEEYWGPSSSVQTIALYDLFSNINSYFTLQTVNRVEYSYANLVFLNLKKIQKAAHNELLRIWQQNGSNGPQPEKPTELKFKILISVESSDIVISTFRKQKNFQADYDNYPNFELDLGEPPNQKEEDEVFIDQKDSENSSYIDVTIDYETLEIEITDPLGEIG